MSPTFAAFFELACDVADPSLLRFGMLAKSLAMSSIAAKQQANEVVGSDAKLLRDFVFGNFILLRLQCGFLAAPFLHCFSHCFSHGLSYGVSNGFC